MAFCGHCGAYAATGSKFCSSCGKPLEAESNTYEQGNERPYQQPVARSGDTGDEKFLCILCYFGILLLIPYLTRPNSQFVKYHSNQGLVLMLLAIACSVVAVIPILGWIASFVGGIFCFVCWVIGIINVVKGEMKPLPTIGKITILK
ncbi:MAG TPA: hypothetical protein GXZ52_07625 [Clostridiales bacterium]|nr:hypothetical protein [Clostridiales bacterium]